MKIGEIRKGLSEIKNAHRNFIASKGSENEREMYRILVERKEKHIDCTIIESNEATCPDLGHFGYLALSDGEIKGWYRFYEMACKAGEFVMRAVDIDKKFK